MLTEGTNSVDGLIFLVEILVQQLSLHLPRPSVSAAQEAKSGRRREGEEGNLADGAEDEGFSFLCAVGTDAEVDLEGRRIGLESRVDAKDRVDWRRLHVREDGHRGRRGAEGEQRAGRRRNTTNGTRK